MYYLDEQKNVVIFKNKTNDVKYSINRDTLNEDPNSYIPPLAIFASNGKPKGWWNPLKIPHALMIRHQKSLGLSSPDLTHVLLHLKNGWFLNVTWPHAKIQHISEIKIYKGYMKMYALKHYLMIARVPKFEGLLEKLGREFVKETKKHRRWYYPWTYDILQLAKIYVCNVLGYRDVRVPRLLQRIDMGYWIMVCSVGARAFIEKCWQVERKLVNELKDTEYFRPNLRDGKLLFRSANSYLGVDVELTTPAHFANFKEDYE